MLLFLGSCASHKPLRVTGAMQFAKNVAAAAVWHIQDHQKKDAVAGDGVPPRTGGALGEAAAPTVITRAVCEPQRSFTKLPKK